MGAGCADGGVARCIGGDGFGGCNTLSAESFPRAAVRVHKVGESERVRQISQLAEEFQVSPHSATNSAIRVIQMRASGTP
jgi:hypothetical protein